MEKILRACIALGMAAAMVAGVGVPRADAAPGTWTSEHALAIWPASPSGDPEFPYHRPEVFVSRYTENGAVRTSYITARMCLLSASTDNFCADTAQQRQRALEADDWTFDESAGTAHLEATVADCSIDVRWNPGAGAEIPSATVGAVWVGIHVFVVSASPSRPGITHAYRNSEATGTACGWDSLMGYTGNTNLYIKRGVATQ